MHNPAYPKERQVVLEIASTQLCLIVVLLLPEDPAQVHVKFNPAYPKERQAVLEAALIPPNRIAAPQRLVVSLDLR
jgi:hypothetical protein